MHRGTKQPGLRKTVKKIDTFSTFARQQLGVLLEEEEATNLLQNRTIGEQLL